MDFSNSPDPELEPENSSLSWQSIFVAVGLNLSEHLESYLESQLKHFNVEISIKRE
jgi:hypothetical protein